MKQDLFSKVACKALIGALAGIISGAILGFIIWTLQIPLSWLNHLVEPNMINWAGGYSATLWPNASFPETLGMSFGAIIGSIMGGIAAFKQFNKTEKPKSK